MTGRKLFSLICISQLLLCPCTHAIELWKEKKNAATSFEEKHDYQRAADLYQAALKVLPANEENAKARIEAALAVDLIAVKQHDRAFSFGEDAVQTAKHLRLHNRLDPDVLLSLQYLLEACMPVTFSLSQPYEQRHTSNQKLTKLKLLLRQALNPRDPNIIDERIAYARTFVALRNDNQAERELTAIRSELSPKSEKFKEVQLAIAGVQEKHGHTNTFASEYLRTHKPESEALRRVAVGKFWAGDYKNALPLLSRAMTKLSGTRSEKTHEEIRINDLYANLRIDHADWKGAELYLRRNVDLLSKDPNDKDRLIYAKMHLSNCLKEQNRFQEASVLEPQKKKKRDLKYMSRYKWILTDEEKAELVKQQAKERAKEQAQEQAKKGVSKSK